MRSSESRSLGLRVSEFSCRRKANGFFDPGRRSEPVLKRNSVGLSLSRLLIAAAIPFSLLGCGGVSPTSGGGPTTPPAPPATPGITSSGTWSATAITSTKQLTFLAANLSQSNTSVTGQVQITGSQSFDPTIPIAVSGTLDGSNNISLTGQQSNETLSISGAISSDGSQLSGKYVASESSSETATLTGTHPPAASGTYTGSYAGSGSTIAASLTIVATKDATDAYYSLAGSATVTGLDLCSAPSDTFTFQGTQNGTEIAGYLAQGGQDWIQISGSTDASGATLVGAATLTNGPCAGFGGAGSITNSAIQDPSAGTPPSTNGQGSITVDVQNVGNGTGEVTINGLSVHCPVTPGWVSGVSLAKVSCGAIALPAGTSSIQIVATADAQMQLTGEWDDCPTAGSSSVVFVGGCTRTLYNIPSGNVTSTATYEFATCNTTLCSTNPF
jgi:hypothetical protein